MRGERLPVWIGLAVGAFVLVVQYLGSSAMDRASAYIFDIYQVAKPRDFQDAPVVIVDIDEESVSRLGQWPWPRSEIARLNDTLFDNGAAVVGYDIVFAEPDRTSPGRIADQLERTNGPAPAIDLLRQQPDNDQLLAESFARSNVVSGFFLIPEDRGEQVVRKAGFAFSGTPPSAAVANYRGAVQPLPQLAQASTGLGNLSIIGDEDGIIRRAPLLAQQDGEFVPSLSLEALRVAQGAETIVVNTSDGSGEGGVSGRVVSIRVGDFTIPTTDAGSLQSYFTPAHPERVIPAWEVLDPTGDPAAWQERLAGKIVFVGASAVGLRDLIATPLEDRELGVMVHAQAAEQMILSDYLRRPDWADGLESALVVLLSLSMALILPRLGATAGATFGVLAISAVMGASWLAFSQWKLLVSPVYPIGALAAVYLVQTVTIFYREEQKRAYIHSAFDRYLSPALVNQIAADPDQLELGGEEREMSVLFCDIRGFSSISEKLGPRELIDFLIRFLTPMCDVLLARKATIDKFIGDAILSFWNAPLDDPDHHRNAARAALDMVEKLKHLNASVPQQKGANWPGEVRIGIGLNSGICCVGNMGSAQRLSYSLLGDTVNLASRLEGLTKFYGVSILVGNDLARHLEGFALLELDRVRVVGKSVPETVHALMGDETLATDAQFADLSSGLSAMINAYRAQDWSGAQAALEGLVPATLSRFALEPLAALYRQRLESFSTAPPPPDWDGAFTAQEK
ncbi:MAG: adenylate/guanylate cyclase domain-containing protein [Sphingomonadaceae bacterium]|nr:adenylate/guanylate cyclase domain-containing protein [Sphingomonadaceae bacterium]